MDKQTVRQAMQQDIARQSVLQQTTQATQQVTQAEAVATKQNITHQKMPQGTTHQKLPQGVQQKGVQQEIQSVQDGVQHVSEQQRRQRQEAQRARQRSQQRAQQKRADKRRRSNIIKILLCAILVLQVICSIQLFMVLQTANRIMDKIESGTGSSGTAQEGNFSQNGDGSSPVNGNVTGDGSQSMNSGKVSTTISGNTGNSSAVGGVNGSGSTKGSVNQNNNQKEQVIEDEDAWKLVLVNKWNEMEEGYVPELVEYAEGHRVDARIEDALRDMIGGARDAGYAIYLLSAYRDVEKQTELYEAEVAEWRAAGYTQKAAEEKAGTIVAVPGTSEHHLGLAVDLVSSEHVKLDEGAEKTKGYKWLAAHCHEYGFILRYPNGATEITGIIYEPWHFRYVGVEAATEIMEAGITLEEYLEQLGA